MKVIFRVTSIILSLILALAVFCSFVLRYPGVKSNPVEGKWYRVSSNEMKSSDGSRYKAFFKKGRENKVLVYFAGGGVSVSEETAKEDMYNKKVIGIDQLANFTMNMGGLATASDNNPFKDWTVIAFPYSTGDFHSGTNEFPYIDKNGKKRTLFHYGYKNYSAVMKIIKEKVGLDDVDAVMVTGYSAGGFAAALLAGDVFSHYFPDAKSKTVLSDASLLLNKDWRQIAESVWGTPSQIAENLKTDNLTLDCFVALREQYGDNVHLLFDSSTRDGDLAKVQHFFDDGILDVDEKQGDVYQRILKENIPMFKERAGASLYVWDGLQWYDDPRNLTMHTVIATPYCLMPLSGSPFSIATWAMNAVEGICESYGLDLVDKEYD